jgi:beta-fructofuranosidase
LVDWERDPQPIIKPGENPSAQDADGVWTGAAVLGPDGNMNIFYTGYNLSQSGKQVILKARAQDRHGGKFQPGLEIQFSGEGRSRLEDIDFRDPFVFYHESEALYWMLVASRLASGPFWSRGCIALLKSTDLETWAFAPEPLYAPNDMFCPECPELFTLPNGKWYLVYSRFQAPNAGTVYRVADSPYGPFRIPRDGSHGRLDGRRWYAAKSCPKASDLSKRIFFGWIGDYVEDEGKWLWGGDFGIPREVYADDKGYLRITTVPEIDQLFKDTSKPGLISSSTGEVSLSSAGSTSTAFAELGNAETEDLLLRFHIQHCDAHSFGVIMQVNDTEKGHCLKFTPSSGNTYTVALLTDVAPLDDFWEDQYDLHLPRPVDGCELVRHDGVTLTGGVALFLRESIVECFCGGRSISFRLPGWAGPTVVTADTDEGRAVRSRQLGWFAEDGEVKLSNVSIRYGGLVSNTIYAA